MSATSTTASQTAPQPAKRSMTIRFGASREIVRLVLEVVHEFLSSRRPAEIRGVDVVVRELLVNAIVHGNKGDPTKSISCTLTDWDEERVVITIEDEGLGFDYMALNTALPENPTKSTHKGYLLIKAIADSIEFNATGNRVTARIRLQDRHASID